ncbi:PASTA domain-containing protein [Actinoplanes sp. NPDC051411]|uniref:PASTA domain-containing protein n=1 Tax=Actinoplanes sp. NPDC051411 TaxID=3155522 RepID=UPI0034318ECF
MKAAFALALTLALAGCDAGALGPAAPTTALLTMPNEVGQNADVAQDSLKKLGFRNVDLGTVDGHHVVVLPQNWTVKAQSARSGSKLAPDAKIVLGCARIGDRRWTLPIP